MSSSCGGGGGGGCREEDQTDSHAPEVQLMMTAIRERNTQLITELLSQYPQLRNYSSILEEAIRCRHYDCVVSLCEGGVKPTAENLQLCYELGAAKTAFYLESLWVPLPRGYNPLLRVARNSIHECTGDCYHRSRTVCPPHSIEPRHVYDSCPDQGHHVDRDNYLFILGRHYRKNPDQAAPHLKQKDSSGHTPLIRAALDKDFPLITLILEIGGKLGHVLDEITDEMTKVKKCISSDEKKLQQLLSASESDDDHVAALIKSIKDQRAIYIRLESCIEYVTATIDHYL
jgi:ankyrin repeat protein